MNDNVTQADNHEIIPWTHALVIGIELIDNQHKQLIMLTNELYRACLRGGTTLEAVFKETMSRMVEYVRFHFTTEQAMLQRVHYPDYAEHKKEHDSLIKTVLETTKDYSDGKKFVPNNFVRFLKDWIVSHIGYNDKIYAAYIMDQMKKGLLTKKYLEG
ncbi:MAG: bacteriohemerythrin [Treponema sp.]|jgi:hemerythrin|nr:bacteriohemerythrin [Treponema sp.]